MKKIFKSIAALTLGLFIVTNSVAQNESAKWYFGGMAGLDFMGPPTILTNGVMSPWEGCASISDAAGNLLFYTDGISVWNKNHVVMANGTGLMGNSSSTQSGVIVKRPGSTTIYYVFTVDAQAAPNGLRYSTVDMSLAAGNGSVTVKNTLLQTPSDEKITAVRHCNGVDIWVVTHDWNSNNFRAFLVTAAGVGAPVVTGIGTVHNGGNANTIGQMKASPNGRKLGLAIHDTPFNSFELYDFNNATGVVSNPLVLGNTFNWAYGCEFSPDGTKFYGGKYGGGSYRLYQWNICAGTNAAILASQFQVATMPAMPMSLQLAMNGKIYVCRFSQQVDGVINVPNALGAGCTYVDLGQSTAPRTNNLGLPNFITSFFKTPPPPFTYTVNSAVSCLTASFSPPAISSTSTTCSSAGYSVTGYNWNFGDPPSGPLNTSTLTNPSHTYPGPGTYTATLIFNYTCGSDTVKVPVTIVSPSISITTTSASCSGPGSATVVAVGGTGPYSYTWMPSAQTTSVATNLTAGIYSVTVKDNGGGCTVTGTANLGSQNLMSGTVTSTSVNCNGASTGSATLSITGGSGTYNYTWTPSAQSTSVATGLAAGVYTVVAKDAVGPCNVTQTVQVMQPTALTLAVAASSPSACANSSISLTANTSGGTAGYSYSWVSGPVSATNNVTQTAGGNYTYSVSSLDANNCSVNNTITVSFVNNPTLSVVNSTVCSGNTATLSANGATNYLWTPGGTLGNTFTFTPASSTTVSVLGSIGACTATATGSITVNALPTPVAGNTGPYCPGNTIQINVGAYNTYTWTGPAFSSNSQNPTVSSASVANGGTYSVAVSDANGCVGGSSTNVVVNPTPVVLIGSNSPVCLNTALTLTASGGTSYSWSGPNGFTSLLQNPTITNAALIDAGVYTVTVTSLGCNNTGTVNVAVLNPTISASNTGPYCVGGTIQLNVGAATSFTWSGPNGFNSFVQNPSIPNCGMPMTGTYNVIAAIGTCTASSMTSVSINPLPTPTISSNSPVCVGQPLNLNGGGGNTYSWTGPGFISTTQNPNIPITNLSNSGNYVLTVTDANNCSNSTTVSIVINPLPNATASGISLCENASGSLSAGGGSTYSWSGPGGFSSTQQNPQLVSATPAAAGQYTVTVTSAAGCISTAYAFVSVNSAPTPNAVSNGTVCLNNILTFSGSGGQTYSWSGPNGVVSTSQTFTVLANTVNYTGTYFLTVTDANNCSATTSVNASVFPIPNANIASGTNKGCVPLCVTFTLNSNPPVSNASWNFGEGSSATGSLTSSACYNISGIYTVSATFVDINGCSNSSTYNVEVYPKPIADFNHSPLKPVINVDPEVTFTDASHGANIVAWNWYFMNTAQHTSTQQNPVFVYTEPGTYPVALVVKSDKGCIDTLVQTVIVGEDYGIYVPNAFTPNSDGLNDVFRAKGFGIVKYQIQIFDRWGEKIYKSEDINEGWDGKYQGRGGEIVQEGVYTWLINVTNVFGKAHELKGHVTLIK